MFEFRLWNTIVLNTAIKNYSNSPRFRPRIAFLGAKTLCNTFAQWMKIKIYKILLGYITFISLEGRQTIILTNLTLISNKIASTSHNATQKKSKTYHKIRSCRAPFHQVSILWYAWCELLYAWCDIITHNISWQVQGRGGLGQKLWRLVCR